MAKLIKISFLKIIKGVKEYVVIFGILFFHYFLLFFGYFIFIIFALKKVTQRMPLWDVVKNIAKNHFIIIVFKNIMKNFILKKNNLLSIV